MTVEHFREFHRLGSPWWVKGLPYFPFVFAALAIARNLLMPTPGLTTVEMLFSSLAVVLVSPVLYFYMKRAQRRAWESQKLLRAPFNGVIGQEGVTWESQYGVTRIPWSDFHHEKSSDVSVVLFTSKLQGYFLCKDYFTSESDWQAASALIKQNVSR
jgi:hypothetical protein